MNRSMIVISLVCAAACDPYSMENAGRTQTTAQCHALFTCCAPEERLSMAGMLSASGISDEETCNEKLGANSDLLYDAIAQAVAAGRAEWDSELARICSQPIIDAQNACDAQAAFDAQRNLPDDCKDENGFAKSPIIGKVADGDLCYQTFECASVGAICELNTSDEPGEQLITTKGECKGRAREGEACDRYACAEDLYCHLDYQTGDATCRAVSGRGDACTGGPECASDLYCSYETSTCEVQLPNGESCSSHQQCVNRCDGATGRCANKLADGVDCSEPKECATGTCNYEYKCGPYGPSEAVEVTIDQCDGTAD
jgi:hypothetical protein